MSLTKRWLEQQAPEPCEALAHVRRELTYASRVINEDRPLDWEDREAIARALAKAGRYLDAINISRVQLAPNCSKEAVQPRCNC